METVALKIEDNVIDYKVGDWVETCAMLPGIVQKIDILTDTVEVFYPHYAFREDCKGKYTGGSHCSIHHCGVHKITPEYAIMLMAIGEDALTELWYNSDTNIPWEDHVEKKYKEVVESNKW